MCLGIPGKILDAYESQGLCMAKVQFGGIVREACLQYVPEAVAGDYVVVHVGFAISKLDEEEAARRGLAVGARARRAGSDPLLPAPRGRDRPGARPPAREPLPARVHPHPRRP